VADAPGTVKTDPPTWEDATRAAPLSVIWPLLGRHVAFHRRLVDLTASVKAALLLSQSIYWTRHGRDITQNGGWFHKTTEQWSLETGLSPKEQAKAREVLKALTLIAERRMGIPARLQFRLSPEELGARLSDRIVGQYDRADWSDMLVVAELLGPSVAYHRALAGIAGGVHGGLMLSRALYLTRLQRRRQLDAWICNSAARWSEEIGLTRREQETARRELTRVGIWEEALRGIPPSLVARVRLDCLLALLTDSRPVASDAAGQSDVQVRVDATGKPSQNGDSRLWHPHILESPNPPLLVRPFRQHSFAQNAGSLIEHSTSETVQPQDAGVGANARTTLAGGGGELIFPERMLPEEREAARRLLRHCGEQSQSLLDELAGRLRTRSVRSSPVAYLRGLIARAATGSFVPEVGLRIAAERLQREKEANERWQRDVEERRLAAERATPEYQARALAERERIRNLLEDLKQRMGTGKQP